MTESPHKPDPKQDEIDALDGYIDWLEHRRDELVDGGDDAAKDVHRALVWASKGEEPPADGKTVNWAIVRLGDYLREIEEADDE